MKPMMQNGADVLPQAPPGIAVEWTVFPAGLPLLQGLAAGVIDVCHTTDVLAVFAQAAGVPLAYVGMAPPAPLGVAVVVPKDSPARSIADLAGRRIALANGSSAHYLLVKALAQEGLAMDDIEPVFLPPSAAGGTFERGGVDAWAIWDPFLAAAQEATQARVLGDGSGVVGNRQVYVASRRFADRCPDLVPTVLAEFDAAGRWALAHRDEMARLLSPRTGIPVDALRVALGRLACGVKPVDEAAIAEQQRIADTFHALGRIPTRIAVREAVRHAPRTGAAPDGPPPRLMSLAVR